jgi:hypothetical protein
LQGKVIAVEVQRKTSAKELGVSVPSQKLVRKSAGDFLVAKELCAVTQEIEAEHREEELAIREVQAIARGVTTRLSIARPVDIFGARVGDAKQLDPEVSTSSM